MQDISSQRPARPVPKQTHCVVLLLFVLFVCAVTAVVAGYLFAEKPAKVVTDPRLEELFTSKDHQQLVKQLDKNSRSIVVGNRKDGLYPFLDSYLSRKITEGFLIKKRLFAPGEDLKWERFPWLAMGYHWLHGQFFSKEQLPTLWLIETRNILDVSDLGQLAAFAEAHPNHRFIVAANETRKGESFGFKKLQYTRPSDASLTKILSNEKLSKIIAKNIVKYHNSSLDFIADLMNTAKVQQVFQSYFSDEAEDIQQLLANSSKAAKLLKGLCKDGKFVSKELPDVLPWNGAVAYEDGSYYWTTVKHIYAYSNANGVDCLLKVKFVEAAPEPEPVEQEPAAEPEPIEQAKTTTETVVEKKTETKKGKKKAK